MKTVAPGQPWLTRGMKRLEHKISDTPPAAVLPARPAIIAGDPAAFAGSPAAIHGRPAIPHRRPATLTDIHPYSQDIPQQQPDIRRSLMDVWLPPWDIPQRQQDLLQSFQVVLQPLPDASPKTHKPPQILYWRGFPAVCGLPAA